MVDIEPIGNRSGLVIISLIELPAANRAELLIGELGDMEGAAAGCADAATGQAVHQHLIRHFDIHHGVRRCELLQRFGLLHSAGEAIQQIAVLAVRHGKALLDHGDDHAVRHQLTGVHVPLCLQARGGLVLDGGAEHIARGDMRDPQVRAYARRLRALACSGRA